MKKSSLMVRGSALTLALFSALPAVAQDTVPADEAVAEEGGTIIVTGSRIRQPNLESTVPITTVSGEEFFETGQVSIGDVLNDLPQLRSTLSQSNGTRFLGTRGLNLLDLRGLGTARTLVLVNGRRHVAGDILSNGVSTDINTIPTDLIERVDVLTGGASSIYGSDAVAGVVNFILKDNYDGIQLRGQAGVNLDYGDAGNQYVSALVGKNFADGRGNVALNVEYAYQSQYAASGRGRNIRQNNNFVVVDTDSATGPTPNRDDVFDRIFYEDIRSATISTGGQLGFTSPTAACGRDPLGSAYTCTFLFRPDGTLAQQTGTRIGLGPNGNYVGGNGYSGREGRLVTLTPTLERISANLVGHFDISEALVPFIEAKYVKTTAVGSQSGPFFSQGTTLGTLDARERPRLDNPYLNPQARAIIEQQLIAGGGAPTGATRFALRKNWTEFGIRDENLVRETWRVVGGLKGDFNDDWNYEISANYGKFKESNEIKGNVNVQRYLLGLDTVRDGSGNIVCRATTNPGGTSGYLNIDGRTLSQLQALPNPTAEERYIRDRLASDIASCVPINPFGDGSSSAAARQYVLQNTKAQGEITQFVASGFVAGDLSQLFELPGGPIAFSVGAEYRRETNFYDLDDDTQFGYAFYNAIPAFPKSTFSVKEVFGEVSIPLLKDMPFAHALTVNGSGRIADYKGSTGTVYTYSGGVDYAPIEDIRFRASYSKSVRAPNLSELFSEQSQNFAPAFSDPCSARNLGAGSQFRAANCAAQGRPANYDFVYVQSLEIVSGGNPNLTEETSKSFTVGGVLEPRFVPGLSLSVDYYDIKINNVITAVAAQTIVNQCYDLPDLNNPFCAAFSRVGVGGATGNGEENFRIIEGSLLQSTLNFAKLTARGLDINLNYRKTFDWGGVSVNGIWTHVLERSNFVSPTNPNFENRILEELGDPKDAFNLRTKVDVGNVGFTYELRYLGAMYLNTYEDFNSLQGRPPENPDYAQVKKYPAVWYHNIRVDADVNDRFNVYLGVDNLFDRQPPYGLTGVGAGSGIYDVRGRYGYAGFVAKF
ncbi:TonB-dependent receptor [Sphingopyxis sp. H050]|uniref:TonB-dependent receptor domain-containing protein n=1 Tax=Sphingopyxis sp. H050 TaxID=1759072 RepID=UPI000736784C|nr:TonB-dependent receptor [Sphingopyxis sp. H050]KTE22110.1 TonB-dependent receptor [Sphingopyxis sp. H050]